MERRVLRAVRQREYMASEEALNAIECLPVLEELDCGPLKRKEALGSLAP